MRAEVEASCLGVLDDSHVVIERLSGNSKKFGGLIEGDFLADLLSSSDLAVLVGSPFLDEFQDLSDGSFVMSCSGSLLLLGSGGGGNFLGHELLLLLLGVAVIVVMRLRDGIAGVKGVGGLEFTHVEELFLAGGDLGRFDALLDGVLSLAEDVFDEGDGIVVVFDLDFVTDGEWFGASAEDGLHFV
eukprot:CAMPEP_0114586648 /NCGR_PEP_ID=MMETSP0125-20121206/9807_1 /TAXON_ID=485358 ORGANISM="Aristerostoma sp., Strain ATCC 50986" /NCGR_SAMPLE_ID=MMETSP0125 /ASSEMBLY_ACC=CAM_ASM_000245 /LENGTH=185 /DNA_ID=CAMNT_0001782167 /DNA_START=821 /DNA_END=1378 /DNA_ORIENTATION=-